MTTKAMPIFRQTCPMKGFDSISLYLRVSLRSHHKDLFVLSIHTSGHRVFPVKHCHTLALVCVFSATWNAGMELTEFWERLELEVRGGGDIRVWQSWLICFYVWSFRLGQWPTSLHGKQYSPEAYGTSSLSNLIALAVDVWGKSTSCMIKAPW